MSVDASISLNLMELLCDLFPLGVEYYQIEFPFESIKETVLNPLCHENAYINDSDLPNTNPR